MAAVDVSHGDTGVLTFAVSTPAERAAGGTTFRVLLDLDRNATTGYAGADYALVVADGHTVSMQEWWVAGWIRRIPRGPVGVTWSNGPLVTVDRGDVGFTNGFGLRVESERTVSGVVHRDAAPEAGAWTYDVGLPDTDADRYTDAADNCPTVFNRQFDTDGDGLGNECDDTPYPLDVEPPTVQALPSHVTRGGVAYLRYRLAEDSRATREHVRVVVRGRTVARLATRLSAMDDGVTYAQLWRAPARLTAAAFCVVASDEAGNVSPEACAALTRSNAPAPGGAGAAAPTGTLQVGSRPTFVLGLSNAAPVPGSRSPDGGDALAEVARAGINMMRVEPADAVWTAADIDATERTGAAAAAAGLRMWVSLRELSLAAPGTPEADLLERLVQRLRGTPGFGLWKGHDEPWWDRRRADSLAYAYRRLRELAPGHPVLTVQAARGTRWDLAPYASVTDAHGVSVYPVSYVRADPTLHDVGRRVATVRAATPSNALLATLQICSGASFDRGGTGAFVLPTLRQERYMAYDAIINGARGLFFFGARNPRCLSSADAPYAWNWTFWHDVLRPLLAELKAGSPIAPALLAPRARLRLRVGDPATQVEARAVGEDELWVLAARHGRGTARVRISGLPAWAKRATVYREGRKVTVKAGSLVDSFGRWGVHVYRFTR
jgi:hypothetical protein